MAQLFIIYTDSQGGLDPFTPNYIPTYNACTQIRTVLDLPFGSARDACRRPTANSKRGLGGLHQGNYIGLHNPRNDARAPFSVSWAVVLFTRGARLLCLPVPAVPHYLYLYGMIAKPNSRTFWITQLLSSSRFSEF